MEIKPTIPTLKGLAIVMFVLRKRTLRSKEKEAKIQGKSTMFFPSGERDRRGTKRRKRYGFYAKCENDVSGSIEK